MKGQPGVGSLALLGILGLVGCAGGDNISARDPSARGRDAGASGGVNTFHNAHTGTRCAATNLTRACECGDWAGRQLCGVNRVWGPCECVDPSTGAGDGLSSFGSDPAANDGNAQFDWLRTAPGAIGSTGVCQPGSYGGFVDGLYNAPSAFNAPVPIVSVDVTGAPGLQLELSPGGNGEFLEVTGGSFNGVALAIFPFTADLADGQLDCSTGMFNARIVNGSYVVFFDGFYGGMVMYQFEGVMVARYDAQARALVDGRWSVAEDGATPPMVVAGQPPPVFPIGMAGGTGTWSASFIP